MPALVSILIPAYNAERWLPDTIRSALAQTWPNKEIIVIDDGSRDETLAVARRFEGPSVKVVAQPNMGAAAARNKAIELAQGEYVQWLDADDLLSANKVMKQMEIALQSADRRVLLSSGWAYFMYRPAAAKFTPTPLWQDLTPLEWMLRKWHHNLHMQTATWLVSRELSAAAGPWDTELLGDDDGEYFTRVVLASHGVRFAPDAKVFYRVVGTSRLSYVGASSRKLEAQLKSMQLQIGYLRALDDSPRTRAAVMTYLQSWLPHFYPDRPDLVAQMNLLAAAVGGKLQVPPSMGWKYAWIDTLVGRAAAKRVQLNYRAHKTNVLRSWDKLLYELAGK